MYPPQGQREAIIFEFLRGHVAGIEISRAVVLFIVASFLGAGYSVSGSVLAGLLFNRLQQEPLRACKLLQGSQAGAAAI